MVDGFTRTGTPPLLCQPGRSQGGVRRADRNPGSASWRVRRGNRTTVLPVNTILDIVAWKQQSYGGHFQIIGRRHHGPKQTTGVIRFPMLYTDRAEAQAMGIRIAEVLGVPFASRRVS